MRTRRHFLPWLIASGVVGAVVSFGTTAIAQNCASSNPADWPPGAKPYFMIVADTSGSMAACTNPATVWPAACPANAPLNACGMVPTRVNDAKCALRKTVQAFSGEVNFGLASYSRTILGCPAACNTALNGTYLYSYAGCTSGGTDCGNPNVLVPMLLDTQPPPVSNVPSLLQYFDHVCSDNKELFANGATPLAASLTGMFTYFQNGYGGNASPITATDPGCRSLNVILLTDGGETCGGDPAAAALTLYNGFSKNGITWSVKANVIAFNVDAAADLTTLNNMAKMGQCGSTSNACAAGINAVPANNEATLSAALANIVGAAFKPEVCDNTDNNCNGCVDEGYKHYCHRNKTAAITPTIDAQCCAWSNTTQRTTCMNGFLASVTAAKPQGDRFKLPCYSPANVNGSLDSAQWLCYDPGDRCDGNDNNCDGTTPNASLIDENTTRCGDPLHCPVTETCNAQDDDCDGLVDNAVGNPAPYSLAGCTPCTPSAEQCDGCDNDCDGVADDGLTPITCGLADPANCSGQISCGVSVPVAKPGACIGAGPASRWGTCTNDPQAEVCDGKDNDCNGLIDDNLQPAACEISGQPGLVYYDPVTNPTSQCVMGQQPCNGQCAGWVGPSAEICDGKDNDCNGQVDEGLTGLGQPCDGVCAKGTTACINGALLCQGAVQPQPETCNGQDDDCNGIVDDGNLVDGPSPADKPCWDTPASSCSSPCTFTGFGSTVQWCAPDGAGCHDQGTLAAPPCAIGGLVCQAGAWKCVGALSPQPETCDGADNDCDGQADNGIGSSVCGNNVGECRQGTQSCVAGKVECTGGVGPVAELCNGKDDDCDTVIDNGIAIGTSCTKDYDATTYPGARDKGQCQPGVSECNTSTGTVNCKNGVGPAPEVCDGLDNDCDGQVDEVGNAPDGINGTANPADPSQVVGADCGLNKGECKPGHWACVAGALQCVGGVLPQVETCNCQDDDCDGFTDEDPESGTSEPSLCSTGKACVGYNNNCQCAAPCGSGEFLCPTGGFLCASVELSNTQTPGTAGPRCVIDGCGDCSKKTVKDAQGNTVCAPAGATSDGGVPAPECTCKENACHHPCFGVSCVTPIVCTNFGSNAGKCVEDNCWNLPCPAGQACNGGSCVEDPCKSATCQAGEVCKPSADFTTFRCTKSCASVTCAANEACVEGICAATGCPAPCDNGQVCAGSDAGGCVATKCTPDTCPNGSYCNQLTGACGNNPCEGVLCPSDQEHCELGECVSNGSDAGTGDAAGGAGGSGGKDSGPGGAGGAVVDGSAGNPGTPTDTPKGTWGLATGGGGCACETAPGAGRTTTTAALGLLALGLIGQRARRRRRSLQPNETAKTSCLGQNGGAR